MKQIDFEQELYNRFGQVKDFTLGMRIAKYFYEMGRNDAVEESAEWLTFHDSYSTPTNVMVENYKKDMGYETE